LQTVAGALEGRTWERVEEVSEDVRVLAVRDAIVVAVGIQRVAAESDLDPVR
jgi:hypothetical protein